MIKNSFIFLPKIGIQKEKNLWKQGIKGWDDFLSADKIKGIATEKKGYFDRAINEARKELFEGDIRHFVERIPKAEHWRLWDWFKDEAVYLDIETSNVDGGFVTVVGMFDGYDTKIMVKDLNLNFNVLKKELDRYKMIVSFNGSVFDVPFLQRYLDIEINKLHFDLRVGCGRIGLKGGLKEVEKKLGIRRENEIIERMHGGDAYQLWRMWKGSGDEHYLKLLVEYNEEDCSNLKKIAEFCYTEMKKRSFTERF